MVTWVKYQKLMIKMKWIFLVLPYTLVFASPSEDYLAGKIPPENCRYDTFKCALELLEQRGAQIIVETGTARYGTRYFDSDGGSTIIFAQWAKDHNAHFFSIDISASHLENAQTAVAQYVPEWKNTVHFVCNDSIAYLRQVDFMIDFLYLDSYDYELDNPSPSQTHHLMEIQAAYPHLKETSIVMIDDCDLPGGGKGKDAIIFLLERGWKIAKNQYQVILYR
jgi:predicted O-methyltransferase YrrM